MKVVVALEQLGGYATRVELVALGCWPEMIDMALWYRQILRVRRGHYASVGTAKLVLRALRVGGRLACVSALDFHEGRDRPERPVHVLVTHGSSRLGGDKGGSPVIHWSRLPVEGTRTVVSAEVARSQAERCRTVG